MRVSITNCVSTAAKMMRFSDESLFANAGHHDLDYVVCKWLPSPEVNDYLAELQETAPKAHPGVKVHVVEHQTDPSIGYVPNLRAMIVESMEAGFALNDFCGLTNTDVYHGPKWLSGLVKYTDKQTIINSLHITAVPAPMMDWPLLGIVNENLGIPEPETFNLARFNELYRMYYRNVAVVPVKGNEHTHLTYRHAATMPYLFHRKWWEECGPWGLTLNDDPTRAPDRQFFDRCRDAGASFALSFASIIYHHEAVERRGVRPPGSEHLVEE